MPAISLAVVRDCAALSAEAMQTIAREMNFSETTFVVDESPTRAKVRIFTPGARSCRSPGIRRSAPRGCLGPSASESHCLELAAGNVDVTFDGAAGIAWMTPPKPKLGDRFSADRAAKLFASDGGRSAAGSAAAVRFDRTGVRLRRRARSAGAETRAPRRTVFPRVHGEGLPFHAVFLFTPQAYSADAHYAARLFFDANGVREDPATGSANSGFAAYLHAHLQQTDRRDRRAGVRDQAAVAALFARRRRARCASAAGCRRYPRGTVLAPFDQLVAVMNQRPSRFSNVRMLA